MSDFYITGYRDREYKARSGEMKTRRVKTGFWKDRSKYTGAKLRELRKARGCGCHLVKVGER